jgi:hypothetical protein
VNGFLLCITSHLLGLGLVVLLGAVMRGGVRFLVVSRRSISGGRRGRILLEVRGYDANLSSVVRDP